MKRWLGIALMMLGLALLLAAGWLYLSNAEADDRAQESVERFMPQVIEAIMQKQEPQTTTQSTDVEPIEPTELPLDPNFYSTEMTVEVIDGYAFVGYLTIPALNLQLPVMAQTDDELLKITPCRFWGSTKTEDLVIGGHNYWHHFGQLTELNQGDYVLFTDMDGDQTAYEMITMEILDPSDADELTSGEYPLTLYTCTYGGASRIIFRFDLIKKGL